VVVYIVYYDDFLTWAGNKPLYDSQASSKKQPRRETTLYSPESAGVIHMGSGINPLAEAQRTLRHEVYMQPSTCVAKYVKRYSHVYSKITSPHPSMPAWALVSPASRGIGLELARRLLRTTDLPLIATARGELDEVKERILEGAGVGVDKGRVEVLRLDVCGAFLCV